MKPEEETATPAPSANQNTSFLARVEAPRVGVLGLDEATALFHPVDVHLAGDVVLDPHHDDQDEADREREADEVMDVFGSLGEAAEGFVPDHRHEQDFPESNVQPCQAENYEGC